MQPIKVVAFDEAAIETHIKNIVGLYPDITYHSLTFEDRGPHSHITVYISYGLGDIPRDLPERLKNEYPDFWLTLIINAW